MGFKEIIVKDQDAISNTATSYSCVLPKSPITSIGIRINGTGGSAAAVAYTMVTKAVIETDTKHKRLVELSSTQLVRRQGLMHGTPPVVMNANGAYSEIPFFIFAGHKVRDKAMMFPLHKANKRELQLTFDTDLLDATSRFTTGTIKITVTAVVWEGALPREYVGFISQQQELSQATGTGDLEYKTMSLPPHGEYIDLDITVSAITTVELIHWTGTKSVGGDEDVYKKGLRDVVRENFPNRDLSATLTLTGFIDWARNGRDEQDYHNGVKCDRYQASNFKVERGSTTTTVVICSGIIKRV